MRNLFLSAALLSMLTSASCSSDASGDVTPEIVALERASLDRWGRGDPQGYIENFAPEITYFDPAVEKRVDGAQAMRDYLTPLTGKIKVDHYDMIAPKVQRFGSVAVLTFQLISYGKEAEGKSPVLARWNSTEVYARIEGRWKIVHNHWSFIKPVLQEAPRE
jgi:ketosteroid isomerase-like protein